MIDEFSSDPVMLKHGVLQGSVLGPILYTLFTSPVRDISRSHNIGYHGFADDTQNCHSFTPSKAGDEAKCKQEIEVCISDICTWMRTNLLKLNDEKTEFLIIGTKQQLSKVKTTSISVGQDEIPCSETARNLGYYYDQHMNNSAHINKLVSSLNVTLRRILKIRNNIDYDTAKILVQAMVLSRLDYCNSLMLGSTKYNLKKLQQVQNCATRIVYRKRFVLHITPYLKELHWLRVEERIQYKIAVLMFKCVQGSAPKYLQELIIPLSNHSRTLRSSSLLMLPVSISKLSIVHNSSFSSMDAWIWNDLPYSVKISENVNIFKSKLKTYLFSKSYDN